LKDVELTVDGVTVEAAGGWTLAWLDQPAGIGSLTDGSRSLLCHVEGAGREWVVTLRGRRIAVAVRTWRERTLEAADSVATDRVTPAEVRATLPGLVVAVAVANGDVVAEGAPLLTIEAMKMQNEVRAPRAGRVTDVATAAGSAVAAGAVLLRIE
jgi:biotin carboxyl carrier protein